MKTIELFKGQVKCQNVLKEVLNERLNQEAKWGEQNHDNPLYVTILTEEVGEVAKAILEKDIQNLREELIQVAAVAVAMVECLDRNQK